MKTSEFDSRSAHQEDLVFPSQRTWQNVGGDTKWLRNKGPDESLELQHVAVGRKDEIKEGGSRHSHVHSLASTFTSLSYTMSTSSIAEILTVLPLWDGQPFWQIARTT